MDKYFAFVPFAMGILILTSD